jgi:Carboxypeptidase regulatory-like domain
MSAKISLNQPKARSCAFRFDLRPVGMILIALLLTVASLAGNVVQAQEFRATLSGAVTDPTGAMVPGASVVVKQTQTGTISRTLSDSSGQYVVPFLSPGDYSVTASGPGFQTVTRNGITLQSQEHPIVNLTLTVGQATETVIVSSGAPLVDLANASVGQVISTESVADLPLNGRAPTTLAELSVGVIATAAPQLVHPFDNNAGNSWSIGGTPNQVSEVLLDGSPDLTLLGALAYAPTQDSVQEVSIRPFDTDASVGHTIGGVINQVTKSGTNRLHGTAYEFNQIPNIDGNLYFNGRLNPVPKLPVTRYNQYGLTVGGPVSIPKVFNGKDKLFFFFAYEGLKDSQPVATTTTVPTSAEINGDFSQTLSGACNGNKGGPYTVNPSSGLAFCNDTPTVVDPNQLYNPFTATLSGTTIVRKPIVNNQLTSVGPFNPVAQAYLALFPAPNATGAAAADGQNNYVSNSPSADTYNNEFGRLDYNLNSRDHVFFDFRHNNRTQVKNDFFGNGLTGTTLTRENFGSALDNVFTLNSSTILDTRLNWTRFYEAHGTPAQRYNPTALGFPSSIAASSSEIELPFINFNTGGSCGNITSYQCLGDTASAIDPTTSYQLFTDVVKVIGRHTVKVGFDGRQYRLSVQNFGDAAGSYTFNSNFVESKGGGSPQTFGGDLATFLFGIPSSGEYDINARSDYHQYYFGAFVQDDWRVSEHLTLNLGVRFDIDTPFRAKLGHTVSGFDPGATNTASGAAALLKPTTVSSNGVSATVSSIYALGGLTFPSASDGSVYKTNSGFLSPRFGFSYSPTGKTVFRGGFGIFVQPETLSSLASTGIYSANAISNSEGFSAPTTYASSTNNGLTPPTNTLSNPFPGGFIQPAGSSLGASTNLGQTISFLAPVQHDPYSERWDVGIQRSITGSTLIEALYIGNHGLHLPVASQNLNAVERQYLSTNPYRDQSLATAYASTVTNPFAGLLPNGGAANSSTVSFGSLIVPYPQFGTAAVTEQNQTIGQSYFNSAILHVEQRSKHGLTITANYSFSKLTESDTFLNDEDTTLTHRISPFDHTHHFTVGGTYALPFGKGKMFAFNGSHAMDEILGGFVINSIYQFQTGQPVEFSSDLVLAPGANLRQIANQTRNSSPIASGTPALSTNLFVTGNATIAAATCTATPTACDGSQFVNNGAYTNHLRTLPQTLSWVRTDGFNNLDASILKNFDLVEGAYLQLRFETFNTLNHPVFASPNVTSATAANFGYITAVTANSLPRQVQLGARIVF